MNTQQRFGQWFFTLMNHTFYDLLVYRIAAPFFWRCKTATVVDNYHRNLSDHHLEIGVGTGFLLHQSEPHDPDFKLSLMDLNQQCLTKSAARLSAYQPRLYRQNVLQPFAGCNEKFQSVGINFVLHCVPGSFKEKGVVFKHIAGVLDEIGVCYGATVLSEGVERKLPARIAMWLLNALRIFHNRDDRLTDLRQALEKEFDLVEIEIVGSVALWRASRL